MSSLFDSIQNTAFDVVTSVFGEKLATWSPAAGGAVQTATVLYRDPTDREKVSGVEFGTVPTPVCEYRKPFLNGLFESAQERNAEVITINSIQYDVLSVEKLADGKTYKASLQLK